MSTIEAPQLVGYTVYSKSNCPYCVKAKELLIMARIIDCDAFLTVDKKPDFLKQMDTLIGREYRTFPMIFYDGVFVGGFTDAKVFYEKEQCFAANDHL